MFHVLQDQHVRRLCQMIAGYRLNENFNIVLVICTSNIFPEVIILRQFNVESGYRE